MVTERPDSSPDPDHERAADPAVQHDPVLPDAAPDPAREALTRLRQAARKLLRTAKAGDAASLSRCRRVPRLAALSDTGILAAVRLVDAQHVIATDAGAGSWPKLKQALEKVDPLAVQVVRFRAAIRDDRPDLARQILARHPAVATADILCAAATADIDTLSRLLAAAPALASVREPRTEWTPILYLAASPFGSDDAEGVERHRRAGEILLDAGADPNSHTLWSDEDGRSRLTALYRASIRNQVQLVRLLLEHGADPNDGESIYHAAERNHRETLELLLQHGAEISRPDPHWGNTPLYFLAGYPESHPDIATVSEGMRWLLTHGADPNIVSRQSDGLDETPLHRLTQMRRGPDALSMLLDHGAAIDTPRGDGRTAYALAVRSGHSAAATLLARRGADTTLLTPRDECLGAAMRGDEAAARAVLQRQPDLLQNLLPDDRGLLGLALGNGNRAAIETLVRLGFDPAWESVWGGTPLHHAAWNGQVDMVELLLKLGAPVNVRDHRFGSSPLAWAAHGSTNCRRADPDYLAVIDRLLDAGADRETSINKWNEPPEVLGSPRIVARLVERSFASRP